MSDTSQGPGWWQASDGKWYPPEQAPGAAPAGPPPGAAPAYGAAPGFGAPPAYGAPGAVPSAGPLASWGERFIARLIDGAIIFVAYIAIAIVGGIFGAISDALGAIVFLLGYLVAFAYGIYIYWLQGETGATPGKRLTGLKVIGEANPAPIGGVQGIVRELAHIIDSLVCYIGWFLPLFDEAKRQTIADKVMHTLVIKDQPKMSFGPELFKK